MCPPVQSACGREAVLLLWPGNFSFYGKMRNLELSFELLKSLKITDHKSKKHTLSGDKCSGGCGFRQAMTTSATFSELPPARDSCLTAGRYPRGLAAVCSPVRRCNQSPVRALGGCSWLPRNVAPVCKALFGECMPPLWGGPLPHCNAGSCCHGA